MNWCFGIVNNQLSEIYFERSKGKVKIIGHCYVKESDYKTKTEARWIKEDTAKLEFAYRKGRYSPKYTSTKLAEIV